MMRRFLLNRIRSSCQEYELDLSKPKVVQFFDARHYEATAGPLFAFPGVSTSHEKPSSGSSSKNTTAAPTVAAAAETSSGGGEGSFFSKLLSGRR